MDVLGQRLPKRAMEHLTEKYTSVLTIAGSDSGGCAGIQADIKTMSACGVYAASVITATTAQNTQGVMDIHPIPLPHIEAQLDAVLKDIPFSAIKIGMLHDCQVIELVLKKLTEFKCVNVVLDPVMVATSGDVLITEDAITCLKNTLNIARVITPNITETELLLKNESYKTLEDGARLLSEKFNTSVLVKGIREDKKITNAFYNNETKELTTLERPFIPTKNTHGTGCSLSSSLASYLALGHSLDESVKMATDFVHEKIALGKDKVLGKGSGPINHFGL